MNIKPSVHSDDGFWAIHDRKRVTITDLDRLRASPSSPTLTDLAQEKSTSGHEGDRMTAPEITPESIRQAAARLLPEGASPDQLHLITPTGYESVQVFPASGLMTIMSGNASLSVPGGQDLNDYLLWFLLPQDSSGNPWTADPSAYATAILFPTSIYLYDPGSTAPTIDAWGIDTFGAFPGFGPDQRNVLVLARFHTYGSSGSGALLLSTGFQAIIGP
jgi:hypothetical protein